MTAPPKPPQPKKRWLVAILLLTLAGLSVITYAFFVEPYWIEVSYHEVKARAGIGLKLAHLTDLHTSGLGRRERKMLALLESEKPDLIVITGDTTANNGSLEMTGEVLRQLKAPLGVWVVRGNWEIWRPALDERRFYESAGVNFLLNASRQLTNGLWLVGLDDPFAGSPDLDAALLGVPKGAFTVALFHTPEYFDAIAGRCDLALAGHMHGGQVRLPLVGPLWVPARDNRFLEGWFERNGSRMYVSRGIGTSIMSMRFYCRPEIAIIRLTE